MRYQFENLDSNYFFYFLLPCMIHQMQTFYSRDFLRLGFPLYCQSLEAPNETAQNTRKTNDVTMLEENPQEKREDSQDLNESLRKISEVTPRKVSDIVNRKLSDTDSHSNTLTFRDVMLSMIQPSSESGSDVESNSDEDEYLIVQNANLDPGHSGSGENEGVNTESDDTPPQPPPRRSKANSKRRSFEGALDLDSNLSYYQDYQVTVETSDGIELKGVMTAEVDGVDIDTIGNTAQEVSYIDQGEDTVILDLKGEAKEAISDSSTDESPERKHSETNDDAASDNDDENLLSAEAVNDTAASPHKAAEMSFDEFSMKLSQIAESHPDPQVGSYVNRQISSLNGEAEDVEDVEKDDVEEMSCQPHGGGAVSLTRVKCVVSMTTPRDARAHGATDCPSFVEFDMSVDGFGCLFLPAIAPQISAGKLCPQFALLPLNHTLHYHVRGTKKTNIRFKCSSGKL